VGHAGNSSRQGFLALGHLLILTACSDRPAAETDPIPAEVRAYARARCERLEHCACKIKNYDDRAQCEAKLLQLYHDDVAGRDTVNLDCFGDAARLWERAPCDAPHDGETCDVTSPTDAVGEPCRTTIFHDMFLYTPTCSAGSFCWNDERCVAIVDDIEAGMPCTPEGLCGSNLTCIGQRCEEPRTEGQPCEISQNCEPLRDLYCRDGVCAAREQEGDACTSREECEPGVPCFEGKCTRVESLICLVAEF
jgi:hypothetical protein